MTAPYQAIREALAMGPTPGQEEANAALAAACAPDTIRALLAERDALAAEVASATEQIQTMLGRMPK